MLFITLWVLYGLVGAAIICHVFVSLEGFSITVKELLITVLIGVFLGVVSLVGSVLMLVAFYCKKIESDYSHILDKDITEFFKKKES